jgi:tetratricopeptide (TPR) repeat protein
MRRAQTLIIAVILLASVGTPAPGYAQQQPASSDWTVELDIAPELSPGERIAELNRRIVAMQARGERGPLLGDLYNDLGVLHAQQQEWPQARDAFIRAVQAKSYDPDFHRNLALVFMRLEDYELAIATLNDYRERGGGQAQDAYRLIAQAEQRLGELDAARATLQQGLQALGRAPAAEACRLALMLAGLAGEQGDSAAAREVLESWQPVALAWRERAAAEGTTEGVREAEQIESNLLSLYIQDGQLLEEAGLAAEAVELYRKAMEMAPDRDELLPRLVSSHLAAGDPMQARVTARLARQNQPDRPGTWIASARIHEAAGELAPALAAYEKAYELAPQTPGLALKVGSLHLQLGQGVEGRRFLSAVIDAPDTPTEVVYNFAVSLMREQMFAAATAPLQRVTREAPTFAGGWLALAQTYRARQLFSRAVPAYEEALRLQPDARTAYNLGVTAGQIEMWDKAVAAYDQTLTLDPDHREAAYNRAVALMRAGRLEEADLAFAAYRERDPEHYRAHLNHGVTLYRLGRYEDAVDVYSRTLDIEVTAEVWDNLGLAYEGLGDKQRAERCYREAKKLRDGS